LVEPGKFKGPVNKVCCKNGLTLHANLIQCLKPWRKLWGNMVDCGKMYEWNAIPVGKIALFRRFTLYTKWRAILISFL